MSSFSQNINIFLAGLEVACEQQTISDDRKCVCCSQATLEVKLAFLLHFISLFLVICVELPRTRPFFEFPSRLELSGVNCIPRWLNSRFFCCKCVNQNSVSGALPNKFVKPYGSFFSCAFPTGFVFGAGNSVSHAVQNFIENPS